MTRSHLGPSDADAEADLRLARLAALAALSLKDPAIPRISTRSTMSGNAPDDTAIFKLDSPCADDDAIRNMLSLATGKQLRVGVEHWLGKSASRTKVFKSNSASEVRVDWDAVNFIFLHVVTRRRLQWQRRS